MLVLDLRWILFGILVLGLAVASLVAWLARGSRPGRRTALPFPTEARAVFERAPFGLVFLGDPETCRYANPYAQRLFGLAASSGPLPPAAWMDALRQDCIAAQGKERPTGRYRSIALEEGRFVHWWVTLWDRDGRAPPTYVVFALDATAQQRAEQSVRDLFSDLSHELRTPIATILTHLEVLRLPDLSDAVRAQSLNLMQVEAKRMSRMASALLELSWLEVSGSVERRPVDLLPLVQEIVTQMTPQAQARGIELALESDAPLELVIGDGGRLKQVYLNLLDNAIRYIRPGDRIVVSLRQNRGSVACAVCDDGPGIPSQHLPHVTRRFYRGVPEGGGGSGLGLALAKEILAHHQSQLQIESRTEGDETGTCVRFALPILPGEEVEAP
jgi:two-component system phosphate regulon sensor histidine kinase PhoR